MSSNIPVSLPAGYATAAAVGFTDQTGKLMLVNSSQPLPVIDAAGVTVATPDPLSGQATTSLVSASFEPVPQVQVMLSLKGDWSGTVQLMRSFDDGVTQEPVTMLGRTWGRFNGNVCEPVWVEEEAGALLYLDIAIDSGTLDWRLSQ